MNILVTGGSGFIGRNIKESFLKDKFDIVAPSRLELDCSDDKSVASYFSKHSFDVVVHSAAKPGHRNAPNTDDILYFNSRMIFNLLKYQDSWGKLINMGSGAIYDGAHYYPKMKEEYFGEHIPIDKHGFGKYIFGILFPHLKNVVDFRIFGIYGKYEDYSIRFISNAICKALFDLPITLKQNRKFDYLYIDDLMPIIDYFIMNTVSHSAYNITPDNSIELLKVAQVVKNITGKNVDIQIAQQGMGVEYSGDNSRLKEEIRNIAFTPIENGIEQLYGCYEANRADLKIDKLLTDK